MRKTVSNRLMFVSKTRFNKRCLRITLLLAVCAAPLSAETSLERVLSLIGRGAGPKFDQILMNLTRNNIANAQLDVVATINGSITIYVHSPKKLHDRHEELPSDLDDPAHVPFNIDLKTSAIGASNTGVINMTTKPDLGGTNILGVNAAISSGNLLADTRTLSETSEIINVNTISTSAVGAINTGTVTIIIN